MNILITGALGFTGQYLVSYLRKLNKRDVIFLSDIRSDAKDENIIYCDIVKSQNKIYFKIDDQLMMPCLESKYDLIKEKEKIIIGIRSEDIVPNISKDSQSTYWNFDKKIDLSEPLGTETQLFFRFGEKEIISRMYNPRPIKVGEKISFEIDLNKVHLFDNKSQKAL